MISKGPNLWRGLPGLLLLVLGGVAQPTHAAAGLNVPPGVAIADAPALEVDRPTVGEPLATGTDGFLGAVASDSADSGSEEDDSDSSRASTRADRSLGVRPPQRGRRGAVQGLHLRQCGHVAHHLDLPPPDLS